MKSEEYRFYALVSRMRYITRWGLMRNTFSENVQEHSHICLLYTSDAADE